MARVRNVTAGNAISYRATWDLLLPAAEWVIANSNRIVSLQDSINGNIYICDVIQSQSKSEDPQIREGLGPHRFDL